MKCPDGHRWYRCAHEELAHPTLGALLMCVGIFQAFVGVYYIVAR